MRALEVGESSLNVHAGIKRKAPLPEELLTFARNLRKSQTDAEMLMWALLRNRRLDGHKFRRQHPAEPYVLDFYCHDQQLAIELDGGQHNTAEGILHDEQRTRSLARQGIRVLRFWNADVLQDTDAVLEAIWNALHEDSPNPLPVGEGIDGT